MPEAAAIYARISRDPAGTSLGTQRQVVDCRALAERRGWTVAEVYVGLPWHSTRGRLAIAEIKSLTDTKEAHQLRYGFGQLSLHELATENPAASSSSPTRPAASAGSTSARRPASSSHGRSMAPLP